MLIKRTDGSPYRMWPAGCPLKALAAIALCTSGSCLKRTRQFCITRSFAQDLVPCASASSVLKRLVVSLSELCVFLSRCRLWQKHVKARLYMIEIINAGTWRQMTQRGACLIEDACMQTYAVQESEEDVLSCHAFQRLTHCHSINPTLHA